MRERFTEEFGLLQDRERAIGAMGGWTNPDLTGIDRIDLTEEDIGLFFRLRDGTLTPAELNRARSALPKALDVPAEDAHAFQSRLRFYAYLGNMLNIVEGWKALEQMRTAREDANT